MLLLSEQQRGVTSILLKNVLFRIGGDKQGNYDCRTTIIGGLFAILPSREQGYLKNDLSIKRKQKERIVRSDKN